MSKPPEAQPRPHGAVVCSTVASMPTPASGLPTEQRPCSVCGQPLWVTLNTLGRLAHDLQGAALYCEGCARLRMRFVQDQGEDIEIRLPEGAALDEVRAHLPGVDLAKLATVYARHRLGVERPEVERR